MTIKIIIIITSITVIINIIMIGIVTIRIMTNKIIFDLFKVLRVRAPHFSENHVDIIWKPIYTNM